MIVPYLISGVRERSAGWIITDSFFVEMSHDYELNVIIHRKRIFFSSFVRDFSAIFCCPAGCSARSPQKVFLTKTGPFPSHCLSSRIIIRTLSPLLCTVSKLWKNSGKNVCKNGCTISGTITSKAKIDVFWNIFSPELGLKWAAQFQIKDNES